MSNKLGYIEYLVPILIVVAASGGALIYKYCFNAPDDNPVEEISEEIIRRETGVDIDLTPGSIEQPKAKQTAADEAMANKEERKAN